MATFKDKNDREWVIEFDGPSLEKIKKEYNLDLAAVDGSGVVTAANDGPLLANVCWILCQSQAKTVGVTTEMFGKAMYKGEVFEGAGDALRQALTDFTPPKKRAALTAVFEQQDLLDKAVLEEMMEKVTDPETKRRYLEATKVGMENHLTTVMEAIKKSGLPAIASQVTAESVPTE